MSRQNPSVTGAGASYELDDTALQDVIVGLLCLSIKERGHLNSIDIEIDISTCDEKIQELISYSNNSAGKLQFTQPEVLGQLTLCTQCKAKLQATANPKGLALQLDSSCLQDETSRTWKDWFGFQQTVEPQSTRKQETLANLGITTAPSGVAPDPLTFNSHPAPPRARLVDTGAPPKRRVPESSCSRATVCCTIATIAQREQGYYSVQNSPHSHVICLHIAFTPGS